MTTGKGTGGMNWVVVISGDGPDRRIGCPGGTWLEALFAVLDAGQEGRTRVTGISCRVGPEGVAIRELSGPRRFRVSREGEAASCLDSAVPDFIPIAAAGFPEGLRFALVRLQPIHTMTAPDDVLAFVSRLAQELIRCESVTVHPDGSMPAADSGRDSVAWFARHRAVLIHIESAPASTGSRNCIWVPVQQEGRYFALLELADADRADGFTPGDLALAGYLAGAAADRIWKIGTPSGAPGSRGA